MRTILIEVAREPGHEPLALVEYGGFQWLVREVDTANGVTVLERSVPDDALVVVPARPRRWGWPPAVVACCAVFLFLALAASAGTKLGFGDVVGVVIGFCVLVWMLDRRRGGGPPPDEPERRWYPL